MAVGVVGIERDVGHHRDLGHFRLDRPDRAVRQVFRVPRLVAGLGAQGGIGIGKKADRRYPEPRGLRRRRHRARDRPARHARHRRDRRVRARNVGHEDRPDQVLHAQPFLGHEVAQRLVAAQPAEARGGVGRVDGRHGETSGSSVFLLPRFATHLKGGNRRTGAVASAETPRKATPGGRTWTSPD